jgi:hypothetical protein
MANVKNSVRRKIVEMLFEAELDEDFELGIEEGKDRAQMLLVRTLQLKLEGATKKNQPGLQTAIDLIKASHL